MHPHDNTNDTKWKAHVQKNCLKEVQDEKAKVACLNLYEKEHLRRIELELEEQRKLNKNLEKKLFLKNRENCENIQYIEGLKRDLQGNKFQLDVWKRQNDSLQRLH